MDANLPGSGGWLMSELLAGTSATLTLVAAIILALGVIWLKGVRPAWRKGRAAWRMIHRVTSAADRLLPFAEEQLRANGGSSLKDQLDRTETSVKGLALRFEDFGRDLKRAGTTGTERHEENVHRFEVVEARLDAIESRLDGEKQ